MWNAEEGIYLNKIWTNNTWSPIDPVSHAFVVAPPNLYPMLAGAPSDAQAEQN